MKYRRTASAMAAGLMTAALISAPVASAKPVCHTSGSKTRCETNGSTSIKAVPETRAPMAGQMMGRMGLVQRPMFLGW